ncbi:MAG: hypothetical protein FWH43_04435, partial [Endomicrobia bacterium]|nr:hypothetical protein [Endomicrobiia bacterium]
GKFNINEYIDGVDEKRLNAGNNASFAVECIKYFNEYIGAGAGISAQIARVIDGLPGRVGFAPLYFSLKVRSWPQEPGLYGYVLGQMGYNFFYSDSGFEKRFSSKEGGFYYGVGLGFAYETFIFEGIYSVNSGSVKDRVDDNKINMEYGKITVSMGYKL